MGSSEKVTSPVGLDRVCMRDITDDQTSYNDPSSAKRLYGMSKSHLLRVAI